MYKIVLLVLIFFLFGCHKNDRILYESEYEILYRNGQKFYIESFGERYKDRYSVRYFILRNNLVFSIKNDFVHIDTVSIYHIDKIYLK